MPRTLSDVIASLPETTRRKVDARAKSLIAEETTLQNLRKAKERTQTAMARKLRIGQESVSRLENRSDMLISTLKEYVDALGGRLHLVAEFPGGDPVELIGLGIMAHHRRDREGRPSVRRAAKKT